MGMRLAGALALVLGVVTFAGPAFAGNGNGNGSNGNSGNSGNSGKADTSAAVTASAPGNSAAAPGQLKKDDATSSQAGAATTAAPVTSSTPVSSQGVKPSNDTTHDTHAAASSTKTKLYGNGKTAGGIAIQNGASPSTVLHGPGNSQPHKAAPCSGGHEVDVHALKSKRHRGSCGSVSPPPGSVTHGGDDKGSDPGSSSTTSTTPAGKPTGQNAGHSKPKATRSPKAISRESGSVLASARRPAAATLPFTGFPLWAGVLVGIVLLGLGLALSLLAGHETEKEVGP